ncbi:putative secreted protein [hydrothermal vent metagenome]|uniref:Putative secreted protein n=1 Tax=hydrothermal vent metagenome TaxID=652676 RepID=A0A3B0V1D2_9ZZZZ
MDKIDSLNQVAKFHSTFKHPILSTPQIPSISRCELRISLLQEELNELKEAISTNDLVEVADALCDIQYVLSGAVLEFGLGDKFVELFNEVQRSNMSKACKTLEEAEKTVEYYKEKKGEAAYIEQHGDLYLVYRDGDKKTLKSVGYSPANLKGILG